MMMKKFCPVVINIEPIIIAKEELTFEITIPIIDPIPMKAVNLSNDNPISILSN